jgi:hypothetical protein
VVFAAVFGGAVVADAPPEPLPEPAEFEVEPPPGVDATPPPEPVPPPEIEPVGAPVEGAVVEDPPTADTDDPVGVAVEPSAGVEPSDTAVVDAADTVDETSVPVPPCTRWPPLAQLATRVVERRQTARRRDSRWEGIIRVLLRR